MSKNVVIMKSTEAATPHVARFRLTREEHCGALWYDAEQLRHEVDLQQARLNLANAEVKAARAEVRLLEARKAHETAREDLAVAEFDAAQEVERKTDKDARLISELSAEEQDELLSQLRAIGDRPAMV